MRGPLIFIMLFYAVTAFILGNIPLASDGAVLLTVSNLENTILGDASPVDKGTSIPGVSQFATTLSVLTLLLTFSLPGVPLLINLLFLLPAAFTVSMIVIQFVGSGGRNQ